MMMTLFVSWLVKILSVCVHMAVPWTGGNISDNFFLDICGVLRVKSVLMLTLFLVTRTSAIKGFQFTHCGEIIPSSPFLFYGEVLNLTCTVGDECYEEGGAASKLYFKVGQNDTHLKGQVINENSTQLVQLHKTMEFEKDGVHRTTYYCFKEDRYYAVNSASIRLDYKPEAPRSVDCGVHNKENMVCEVYLGQKYEFFEDSMMNITCEYRNYTFKLEHEDKGVEYKTTVMMECRKEARKQEDVAVCKWDGNGHHFFRDYIYSLKICVINKERDYSNCSSITVDTSKIVKPVPVMNLTIKEQMSKCVSLSWTHDVTTDLYGLRQYQVLYKSECESEWKTKNFTGKDYMQEQICGLVPNMDYAFEVQVITIHEQENITVGFWSNPMGIPVKTLEDIPVAVLTPFFDIVNADDGNRTIRFFWKPLNKCETHGIITKIEALVRYLDTGKLENITEDLTGNIWLLKIPSDVTVDVRMRLGTSVGFSEKSVQVVILSKDQLPDLPEFVVERSEELENYNLTITGKRDAAHMYTVFWYFYSLQDGFNYVELPHSVDVYTISGSRLLKVGLSLKTNQSKFESVSTGVHWTECVYQRDKVPSKPPPGFYIESKPADGFTVHWNHYLCEDSGYVMKFIIKYCKIEELDADNSCEDDKQWRTQDVSNKETAYTVSNLKGSATYMVKMEALTYAGSSDSTETQFVNVTGNFTTGQEAGVNVGEITGIYIVIGIIGAVVVVAVLIILVKKFRKFYKRRPEIMVPPIDTSNGMPVELDTVNNSTANGGEEGEVNVALLHETHVANGHLPGPSGENVDNDGNQSLFVASEEPNEPSTGDINAMIEGLSDQPGPVNSGHNNTIEMSGGSDAWRIIPAAVDEVTGQNSTNTDSATPYVRVDSGNTLQVVDNVNTSSDDQQDCLVPPNDSMSVGQFVPGNAVNSINDVPPDEFDSSSLNKFLSDISLDRSPDDLLEEDSHANDLPKDESVDAAEVDLLLSARLNGNGCLDSDNAQVEIADGANPSVLDQLSITAGMCLKTGTLEIPDYTKVCAASGKNDSDAQQRSAGKPVLKVTPTEQSPIGIQGKQHFTDGATVPSETCNISDYVYSCPDQRTINKVDQREPFSEDTD